MPTVDAPERPPHHQEPPPDTEALLREARRRARRRRAAYGAAVLAVAAAVGLFFAFGGRGGKTPEPRNVEPARPHNPAAAPLPQAGEVEGTLRVPPQDTVLFTARARSLFALLIRDDQPRFVTALRVDRAGHVTRRRLAFDRPSFLRDVSAGPDGIYAGTSVIRRFTNQPDVLLRIDARTLRVRARASFAASVATVPFGRRLWAALGDGRVVRLDPRSLAVEASRRILPAASPTNGAATLSKPAVGLGSLWVLAGNARDLELVRLDPQTLVVRSRTLVPTRGRAAQTLNGISTDSSHVDLVGSAFAAVAPNGGLGRRIVVPGVATAVVHGRRLLALTADTAALLLLDPHGRILARTPLLDAGAELAVAGTEAWLLGNGGHGDGIVHVHVGRR